MRLNYKILFIEDSEEWLESKIDQISDYLSSFGFNLDYKRIENYEEGFDFSKYDVIAIDLNLSKGENGSDIIDKIRKEEKLFTDVLFYSMEGEDRLRNEIASKRLDGVYCSHREDFAERLKRIIYTTIRKTQELNNLRGLVMAEEAELQTITSEILWNIHSNNHESAAFIREFGKEKTKKFHEKICNDVENIDVNTNYKDFFDMSCHGAFIKQMTLKEFIKKIVTDDSRFDPVLSVIGRYETDVIEPRNMLAHSVEEDVDGKIILVNKKGTRYEFTEEKCTKIRQDIKKHKENLRKITELLGE